MFEKVNFSFEVLSAIDKVKELFSCVGLYYNCFKKM